MRLRRPAIVTSPGNGRVKNGAQVSPHPQSSLDSVQQKELAILRLGFSSGSSTSQGLSPLCSLTLSLLSWKMKGLLSGGLSGPLQLWCFRIFFVSLKDCSEQSQQSCQTNKSGRLRHALGRCSGQGPPSLPLVPGRQVAACSLEESGPPP